jgi:hypothetical protein
MKSGIHAVIAYLASVLLITPTAIAGERPTALTADTFSSTKGTVFFFVNWGRAWGCGDFENAQLQEITFAKIPYSGIQDEELSLKLGFLAKILAKNQWIPYAYVVDPGEYALVAFDLKVANSTKDIRHLKPVAANLIKDNKPVAGTFKVAAGEIVYIGNFWVDCTTSDPIPWRYFSVRSGFLNDVADFRKEYPFTKEVPIQYRLFSTNVIGQMLGVEEYSIK